MFSPQLKPLLLKAFEPRPPSATPLVPSISTSLNFAISSISLMFQRMAAAMETSYLVPAILLNPILFLHSINTLLAQLSPTSLNASAATTSFTVSSLKDWPEHRVDMHENDHLCWSYAMVIVCAQCWLFGKVSSARERKKIRLGIGRGAENGYLESGGSKANGHTRG